MAKYTNLKGPATDKQKGLLVKLGYKLRPGLSKQAACDIITKHEVAGESRTFKAKDGRTVRHRDDIARIKEISKKLGFDKNIAFHPNGEVAFCDDGNGGYYDSHEDFGDSDDCGF